MTFYRQKTEKSLPVLLVVTALLFGAAAFFAFPLSGEAAECQYNEDCEGLNYCSGPTLYTYYCPYGTTCILQSSWNCNTHDGWYSAGGGYQYYDYTCYGSGSSAQCNYVVTQSCTHDCTASGCYSSTQTGTCGNYDSDPCNEWGNIQSCPSADCSGTYRLYSPYCSGGSCSFQSSENCAFTPNCSGLTRYYNGTCSGGGCTYSSEYCGFTPYCSGYTYYYSPACTGSGCTYSTQPNSPTCGYSGPSNLSATPASQAQINLSWTFGVEAINYVYRNGSYVGSAGSGSYGAAGLTCNTQYSFYVCDSSNCTGTVYATTDQCTPGAPSSIGGYAVSQTSAAVTWTRNSPYTETGFNCYLRRDIPPNQLYESAGAGATTYTISGFSCGSTNYGPAAQAYVTTNGRTYYSSYVENSGVSVGTDQCTPANPTMTSAATVSQTQAIVYFTDNSTNETGFVILDQGNNPRGNLSPSGGTGPTSGYATSLTCGQSYAFYVQAYVTTNGRTYYSSGSAVSNWITTTACNQAPTAQNVTCSVNEASACTLTSNASDPNSDPLTIGWFSGGSCGGSPLSTGSTYPAGIQNEPTTASYSYKAFDGSLYSNCATANATWVNVAPTATGQNGSANECSPVSIGVTGSDPGGTTFAYRWYTGANCAGYLGETSSNTYNVGTQNEPASITYYTRAIDAQGLGSGCNDAPAIATWNNVAPSVSPSNDGPKGGSSTVTFSANASDPCNTTFTYQWYTDSGCTSQVSGATASTYAMTCSYPSVTRYVKAWDAPPSSAPSSCGGSTTTCTDSTPPETGTLTANPSGWTSSNVTVSGSCSDTGGSGVKGYYYKCTGGAGWSALQSGSSISFLCTTEAASPAGQIASAYCEDNAGNTDATPSPATYYIDKTVPTFSSKTTFSGCHGSIQTSTFTYVDALSGIASGNNPTCTIYEGTNQTCTLSGKPNVCDVAGNCMNPNGTVSNPANVDLTPPTFSSKTTFSGWYSADQTSTFTYADALCGIASGNNPTCTIYEGTNQTCTLSGKPNVCDVAGNCMNPNGTVSNPANVDKTAPIPNPSTGSSASVCHDGGSARDITWTITASTDAGAGLHATAYSFNGGSSWQASNVLQENSVSGGQTYQKTIRARDALGTMTTAGTVTNSTTCATAPSSVTTATATPAVGRAQASVEWVGSGAGGYQIYRFDGVVTTTIGNTSGTTYPSLGLACPKDYLYTVVPYNADSNIAAGTLDSSCPSWATSELYQKVCGAPKSAATTRIRFCTTHFLGE